MRTITLLCVLLLAGGCASLPNDYEQSDKLVLARESFDQRAAACREAGGSMRISAKATKLQRPRYSAADYRVAYCD